MGSVENKSNKISFGLNGYLSKDINYDYISKRVKVTWETIMYGIERNYILPNIAIEHAINELSQKENYPQYLIELASLSKDESVYPYLNELADLEIIEEDEVSKDKWLYLMLDWTYNNRHKYSDSLGLVEQIYADFDYPVQISTFVRYMPSNEPDLGSLELNEARLYRSWGNYLEEQYRRFSEL